MSDQRHIRVLIVEDDDGDAALICRLLEEVQDLYVDTERAVRIARAEELLKRKSFDIVLLDLDLPDSRGIDTLVRMREGFPDVPIIILTGHSDEATAMAAVGRGAQDFLVKGGGIDTTIIVRSIRYAMERQKLLSEMERSLREVKTLRGLIPMCAWCRKIRDDGGYWKKVETYIAEHTDAAFSHGICPECLARVDPVIFEKAKKEMPELVGGTGEEMQQARPGHVDMLLIEDDDSDAALILKVATEAKGVHIELVHAQRLSQALEYLSGRRFDLVLCDLGLPDSQGLETLIRIRTVSPRTPVVVLTGMHDEDLAVQAVRSGAQDYLEKGRVTGGAIQRVISYSIERQRLLTELGNRLTEIGKLQRERTNMLSMFAHDIRNAIVPSAGLAARVLSGRTRDKDADLAAIRDGLTTAERLLSSFIEFSRLESKEYRPSLAAFDIEASLRRQIETARMNAEEKNIRIEEVFPDIPLQAVTADEGMVQRVIANLLDNAVKYTRPGGLITVRVLEMDEAVVVQIRDSGSGIPQADIPFIFDAFYRAQGGQRGSGLGLSIAKAIVKRHGGDIWVESAPGKGSTFSFSLPRY